MEIKLVDYKDNDFIELCKLLEEEHVKVIKEQRSPKANCLNNLDKFKYVYIAYIDAIPVGCLAMKEMVNNTIEVGRLFVNQKYRNKKIAYHLFETVEEQAHKLGANKLTLDTYKRFEAAVHLYKKIGFYEIDNYIEGSPYSICMEKII